MKPLFRRVTALILFVCLLLPVMATAVEVMPDGHVISHPELLEQFMFPEDWSADPLRFCVGNGILKGRTDGLAEGEPITRAETAALLVRMLGAESNAPDLSRFTDAAPNAWYYPEAAAAVEQGILNGTSDTTLAPNAPVTREQAFTLIARAFGLFPENEDRWKDFSDGTACAEYARDAVSALAERGVVAGYPDGTVRPAQPITRAELAKLLYCLFTCICDDPADLPESGSVLYRGNEPIPEGYVLAGSLTIGCGLSGEVSLTGLSIQDTLTLRPAAGSSVVLQDCTAETVVCGAMGMTLHLTGNLECLVVTGENVTLTGTGTVKHLILNAEGCSMDIAYETMTDRTKLDPADALEIVETLVVWDTVTRDTALYSYSDLTGWKQSLPAGTKLDHYYYREGNRAASVYTEDGRFGWVDINCIEIPSEYEILEPYPQEIMEAFVNQKGYDSSTRYLIWVSLKTQTVNVFESSKGEWSLIRSMPCASGKNSTPTARGEFAIKNKLWEWDFGTYKVCNVTVFYGGYAFHSRIYNRSYTELLDDAIGYPASDGCLRMLDEDCEYIMDEMPYNTRVVVY